MKTDEPTEPLPEDGKTTQPTLTALLELVRSVKRDLESNAARVDARFDAVDARFDAVEERLARDIEGVNARIAEVKSDIDRRLSELSYKMDAINKSRLQMEGDYMSLLHRITELESKAS